MRNHILTSSIITLCLISCSQQNSKDSSTVNIAGNDDSFAALISEQSVGGHDLAKFLNSGQKAEAVNANDGAYQDDLHQDLGINKSDTTIYEINKNSEINLDEDKFTDTAGGEEIVEDESEILKLKKLILTKDQTIASLQLLNDELLIQLKRIRGSGLSFIQDSEEPDGLVTNRLQALQQEIANLKADILTKSDDLNKLSSLNNDLVTRLSSLNISQTSGFESTGFSNAYPKQTDREYSKSTLEFDAVVTLQNGKNKEIFYTEFFLLRKQLSALFSEEGIMLVDYDQIYSDEELWAKSRKSPFAYPGLHKRIRNLLLKEIETGRGNRVRTDIDGFATINEIAPGNYFLLGMSQMGKTGTVWNLPISLKPGHNKLSLTLGNATWSN